MLAAAGGAAGVLVAVPLTLNARPSRGDVARPQFLRSVERVRTPRVDARVVLFSHRGRAPSRRSLFGLVPALQATRLDLTSALKDRARADQPAGRARVAAPTSSSAWRRRSPWCCSLPAALSSPRAGTAGDHGSRIRSHASADVPDTSVGGVVSAPKAPALRRRVLAEIERVPGVEAASVDGCAPVGTGCANTTLYMMGRPQPRPDEAPGVLRHYVGPDHFRTLGVPVLRGRVFDERDRAGSAARRHHQSNRGDALLAERGSDRQARLVRRRQQLRPAGLERRDRRNRRRRRVSGARRAALSAGLLHAVRAVHLRDANGARANAARSDRPRARRATSDASPPIRRSRCSTFARWTR